MNAAMESGDYSKLGELMLQWAREVELMSEAQNAYNGKCAGHSPEEHCAAPGGTAFGH